MFHYVDNTNLHAGDGKSWGSAWNSFAAIDWSVIKPGDTIYISGGTDGRVYKETLTVGASGSLGGAITITKGIDPGHDGAVVIDGEGKRWNGVYITGRDHVVVSNLDVRNITDAGFCIRHATAGVIIENNSVFSGDNGDGNARGFDVRNCVGTEAVIVRGNSFTTPTNTRSQTDGIYSMDNDGVVYEKNRIVISNDNDYGHSDAFQSFRDKNIIVRDNWFEQANSAVYHNHGAWMENTRDGGIIKFYNNVVITPNLTGDAAVAHYMRSGWNEKGTIEIWNNTIIGSGRAIYLENSPAAQVYNNIVVPSQGGHAMVVLNGAPPTANIDGNLMWSPSGTTFYMGKANLSWSDWKALGYDAGGLSADPRFVAPDANDYSLRPDSPAIDRGVALPKLTTDHLGAPRTGGHDIGAFEFALPPPPDTSPDPVQPPVPEPPAPTAPAMLFGTPGLWGQQAQVSVALRDYGGTEYLGFRAAVPWGEVQVAQTASAWQAGTATRLALDNFVETKLDLRRANEDLDLMVVGAQGGTIHTGSGNDVVTWVARSGASVGDNRMVIRTGDGDDVVRITAAGLTTLDDQYGANGSTYLGEGSIATVFTGAGGNQVTVEGEVRLVLHGGHGFVSASGGAAADRFNVGSGGGRFEGGAGRDLYVFGNSSGSTYIEDFTSRSDRLKFLGMTAEDISTQAAVQDGVAGLPIAFGDQGTSVFLAHVTQLAKNDLVFG